MVSTHETANPYFCDFNPALCSSRCRNICGQKPNCYEYFPDVPCINHLISFLFCHYRDGLCQTDTGFKNALYGNKALSVLSIVFIIVFILQIWVTDTSSLLVSYGIIGAGLAFALQDVFKNFVGGILIIVSGYYRVGDRITIDDKSGDVMDIGILNTTLMEIRGWVGGDQPSGRLLMIMG